MKFLNKRTTTSALKEHAINLAYHITNNNNDNKLPNFSISHNILTTSTINRSNIKPNLSFAQVLIGSESNSPPSTGISNTDNISNFNNLISEIKKLKQIIDLDKMLKIIKNLNIKLQTCNDGFSKLQVFIEAAEQI